MTEGGLLHTPACLVGHRVGQPDGVEVILHNTVAWPSGATSALAYPRQASERDRADLGQPVARPDLKPAVHGGLVRSATRSSSSYIAVSSTPPHAS